MFETIKNYIPDSFHTLSTFILILIFTLASEWLAQRGFNRFIKKYAKEGDFDPTNYKFLGNALRSIIYTIGIIFAIREYPPLNALAGSLLTGAGILAVAVGFASQQAFSNIIAGIFIIIFKPFRVNDRLKLRGDAYSGVVEDITLRHTVLRDNDNRRIIVPNTVISAEIILNANQDDGRYVGHMEVAIDLMAAIDPAKFIIQDVAAQHPLFLDPRKPHEKDTKPVVEVRVMRITDRAVVLRASLWSHSPDAVAKLQSDVLENVKKRFDTEGVAWPLPSR